jgi:hypothetical protein
MSERGVFAVDRGIWEHPSFANEPLTEREAWIWLIGEASFKARARNIGGKVVQLDRGQLAASVRFMAERWKWSKSRVDRFLKRLKIETMIGTDVGTGLLVITICNYDRYQRVSLPDWDTIRDAERDTDGTVAGQSRDKREDTESTEYTEGSSELRSAPPSASAPVYTDSRHELWGEGVPILISLGVADRSARSNIGRWLKTMRDDAQAVLGAIQRARDNRVHNPIPWITQALAGPANGARTPDFRTNRNSPQSGSASVLAGVAAATERRARERSAAGQQRSLPVNADPAPRDDADLFRTEAGAAAHC